MATAKKLFQLLKAKGIHPYLDNGKLKTKSEPGAITAELAQQIKQNKEQLVDYLAQTSGATTHSIPQRKEGRFSKATVNQKNIWLKQSLDLNSTAYNVCTSLHIKGELNIQALREAVRLVSQRHHILNSYFFEQAGELLIEYVEPKDDVLQVLTVHRLDDAKEQARKLNLQLFDLSEPSLFRPYLISVEGENEHIFVLCLHHIITDGWSNGLLFKELEVLYNSFAQARPIQLPEQRIQFGDYADWVESSDTQIEQDLAQWEKILANAPPVHSLPLDGSRAQGRSNTQSVFWEALHVDLLDSLKQQARRLGVSHYVILEAALALTFSRWSDQQKIVIGTSASGRSHPELESVLGCFVNPLVLCNDVAPQLQVDEYIKQTMGALSEAFKLQQVPFDKIVSKVVKSGSTSHAPIFQLMFDYQRASSSQQLQLHNLQSQLLSTEDAEAKYDIEVTINEYGEGLNARWNFAGQLFAQQTIESMHRTFVQVLMAMCSQNTQILADISVVAELEVQPTRNFETEHLHSVMSQFEKMVDMYPEHVAVQDNTTQLTYSQLNVRANRIAALMRSMGAEPNQRAAIFVEPSVEMLIAILACIKSGATYVPIDTDLPEERIEFMLEDSDVSIVLTSQEVADNGFFCDYQVIPVDLTVQDTLYKSLPCHNVDIEYDSLHQLGAYILYTSGSTGQPKGVTINHLGLANYLDHAQHYFETQHAGAVVSSSIGFDATITSLLTPLCLGKTVSILEKGLGAVIQGLKEHLFEATQPWVFKMTPAHLDALGHACRDDGKAMLEHTFVIGGEQLDSQQLRSWQKKWFPIATFINEYGPTEAVVGCSTFTVKGDEVASLEGPVPIGKPIQNTNFFVIKDAQLVPRGGVGELYIHSVALSDGYLNLAQKNKESFVSLDSSSLSGMRLYKTGDLVKVGSDGEYRFLGRNDDQVKINGYRIEIKEVESAILAIDGIDSVVVLNQETSNRNFLVAYIVTSETPRDPEAFIASVKMKARQQLADYMIPPIFEVLASLPLNANQKVDKEALPRIDIEARLGLNFIAPTSDIQKQVCDIWTQALGVERIGIKDNFMELGGNSILFIQLRSEIEALFNMKVDITSFFEFPTIESFCDHLQTLLDGGVSGTEVNDDLHLTQTQSNEQLDDVAVIAMSGRFPGAKSVEQLWDNILSHTESLTEFSKQELLDAGYEEHIINSDNFVGSAALVESDVKTFDATFFDMTPREAEVLDPQYRLVFECAVEVLEKAGYGDFTSAKNCGVFVGSGESQYLYRHLLPNPDIMESLGLGVMHGTSNNYLATRLAYKLNLQGPSINIATACSTSLVSIHQAVNSIRLGECEMAIAGGAGVAEFEASGYLYQQGGIESPDGHCRAFDNDANGTRGGNGAGLVLLKSLQAALRDGDEILAVIKGSAINNDGALKAGYTAPSVQGQSQVIRKALLQSKIPAHEIQYIETHGTGTPLGDPIEVKALSYAFSGVPNQHCALGTLKPNIGHLDAAAGVTGFIKTVMALKNATLPPSINFKQANEMIDFENSPFYINTEARPWQVEQGHTRKAGVSAFGIGGTNVHMILEQAPQREHVNYDDHDQYQLIPVSAKDDTALKTHIDNLGTFLVDNPDIKLADVAHTLQVGRGEYLYRQCFVAKDTHSLREQLSITSTMHKPSQVNARELVFLLSGQGAQYSGMVKGLLECEPFKVTFERCRALFLEQNGCDILALLDAPDEQLEQTEFTQPVLFSIEYALAQQLKVWGIEANYYLGHSLGEVVAACLAGVFSLADAVKVIARRALLMQQAPNGAMLVVQCEEPTLTQLVAETSISISVFNGDKHLVVGGEHDAISRLQSLCEQQSIDCQRVRTSHAFHTNMMSKAAEQLETSFTDIEFKAPKTAFMSNVTGQMISAEQACDPKYWAKQVVSPVRLAQNINALSEEATRRGVELVFLELGPNNTLTNLVKRNPATQSCLAINLIRHPKLQIEDARNLYKGLAKLWCAGVALDWTRLSDNEHAKMLALPTYPFNRKKYWVERLTRAEIFSQQDDPLAVENWFYQSNWQLSEPLINHVGKSKKDVVYLCRNRSFLETLLATSGVNKHSVFADISTANDMTNLIYSDDTQVLSFNPLHSQLCNSFAEKLNKSNKMTLVYCDSFLGADEHEQQVQNNNDFIALINIVAACVQQWPGVEIDLYVATEQVFRVDGNEQINTLSALLRGVVKVAPQEFSNVSCYHVDFASAVGERSRSLQRVASQLFSETQSHSANKEVAFRGNARWIRELSKFDSRRIVDASERNLCPGAHIFITGGLGNIGMTLAKWLAEFGVAKVTLLSRRGKDSVAAMPKLEHGELHVVQGDVSNFESLQSGLHDAVARFGEIHTVIHAAGNIHDSAVPLVDTDEVVCEQQFSSKVTGLLNLDRALESHNVQNCVLMSSVAVELGGLGFTAYTAANAYMDAFCNKKQNEGDTAWISINWDGWAFGADAARSPASLTAQEGVESMYWVLRSMHSGVVINSKTNLLERTKKWIEFEQDDSAVLSLYDRPELSEAYCAPQSETQKVLVQLWQEALGISNLGINDNFFELGGDSLLATRLVGNVCKRFNVTDAVFSLKDFFAEPTIISAAQRIDSHILAQNISAKRDAMLSESEELEEGVF